MTTFGEISQTCALCGAVSTHHVNPSSNSYDTELDGCPLGMARDCAWGAPLRCPNCGYCSPSLEFTAEGILSLVKSLPYQSALLDETVSENIRTASCAAWIMREAGQPAEAFRLTMLCAWLCDDAGQSDMAKALRRTAARDAGDAAQQDQFVAADGVDFGIMLADLGRRTGLFQEAGEVSRQLLRDMRDQVPGDWRMPVVEMQALLIAAEDNSAHSYGEADAKCRYPWIFANGHARPLRDIDMNDLSSGLR